MAYDFVVQFAQVGRTDELRSLDLPALVLHVKDIQIVLFENSEVESV